MILTEKGMYFANFEISDDQAKRQETIPRFGSRSTVLQIFTEDFHVSGYTDLATPNSAGSLDALHRHKTSA